MFSHEMNHHINWIGLRQNPLTEQARESLGIILLVDAVGLAEIPKTPMKLWRVGLKMHDHVPSKIECVPCGARAEKALIARAVSGRVHFQKAGNLFV